MIRRCQSIMHGKRVGAEHFKSMVPGEHGLKGERINCVPFGSRIF